MKRAIFKLLAAVHCAPENHKKNLLRREAPPIKHRLAGLLGFAMTTFFLVNQPGVIWGQGFPQLLLQPAIGNPSCSGTGSSFVVCGGG
jgi:hypothetical protein